MNTHEPDSSPAEPSALQVERATARPRRLIPAWLLLLLLLILIGIAGGATLLGRSLTPAPEPSPSAAVQSSSQPRITWSENEVEIILSPGESASRSLTFTSSRDLRNVVIEAVPTIAPFVTITPSSFARIRANQPQTVAVNFSIPANATLGDYNGTIHIRTGGQTLPQTLKVSVSIWRLVRDAALGFSIKIPKDFVIEDTRETASDLMGGKVFFRADSREILVVQVYANPNIIPIRDWFESVRRGHEFSGGFGEAIDAVDTITDASFSGHPAIHVIGTLFGNVEDRIFIADGARIVALHTSFSEVDAAPADVVDILTTLSIP